MAPYGIWHAGLERLVTMLAGRLESFIVTGPSALAWPWETEAADATPPGARLNLTAAERRKTAETRGNRSLIAVLAARHGLTGRQVREVARNEAKKELDATGGLI